MKDHKQRAHAILSPSGSSRWINCTPSARLEENEPDTSGVAAQEGTLAHEYAELELLMLLGRVTTDKYIKALKKIQKSDLYSREMEGHVEGYVNYVKEKTNGMFLYIENRLDLTQVVPEAFGSLDAGAVSDDKLVVIDFKYGRGVSVSVVENSQLRLYAKGLINEIGFLGHEPKTVEYHIYQPRANNVEQWDESIEDLEAYIEEVIKPKAKEAFAGEGARKVGDWCTFCKVAASCPAQFKENLKQAKVDFSEDLKLEVPDVDEVPLEVLAQIHLSSKDIVGWLNKISTLLMDKAMDGEDIPGLMLIEGSSRRSVTHTPKLLTDLRRIARDKGLKMRDLITEKAVGVGELEALLETSDFDAIAEKHIKSTQTKPSLVKYDSTRPAFDKLKEAIDDFTN